MPQLPEVVLPTSVPSLVARTTEDGQPHTQIKSFYPRWATKLIDATGNLPLDSD
jgi:hypothetical protein